MSKLSETLDRYQKKFVHFIRTNWKLLVLAILVGMSYFFFPIVSPKVHVPPYLQQNGIGILIVIVVLTVILVVSKLYNIKFKKPNGNQKVSKMIVVEKMTNEGGFCDRGSESLEKSCGELLEKSCNTTDCCAWTKRNGITKCIAGGGDGPTFKTDEKGNKYQFDFYYFKKKKITIPKLI